MLKFLSIAQIVHPSQLHRLSLSLTVQRVMIKALQNHVFFHLYFNTYLSRVKQLLWHISITDLLHQKILMVTFGENDH